MSNQMVTKKELNIDYKADCENCFGLCCVALPFIKSSDFAVDKAGGIPCVNLQSDFRCGIHTKLRQKGFKGCTVYECFGAGQKVSQITYTEVSWQENPTIAKEMFEVFPIMQQLHEMLYYLQEALNLEETQSIQMDLHRKLDETKRLTQLRPQSILKINIPSYRAEVNDLLLKTSELVRSNVLIQNKQKKIGKGMELLGAKLRGSFLRGSNLRGAFLIAADLRECDLTYSDFIGADLRDADIRGANLQGSIFLTQIQLNAAIGDKQTRIPEHLSIPTHWSA